MRPDLPFYSLELTYMVISTCASIGILIFDFAMLAMVRRKHLEFVVGWLVPATFAAAVATCYYVFSDLRVLLGLRISLLMYLVPITSGIVSSLLSAWAAVGLWKMIHKMPDNTSVNPPQALTNSPATWPPPPTIPS